MIIRWKINRSDCGFAGGTRLVLTTMLFRRRARMEQDRWKNRRPGGTMCRR
jgi:hypothetical protein